MRDGREVRQLFQHIPLLGVGRPPPAEPGFLAQPRLRLALMGGQPYRLVGRTARDLPSFAKVPAQPGSED
eukprot:8436289-Alexandrium_andersonii.AAC.1